ncbi:organelle RRM domain-containing protein 2, mitochondrial-like isoform X2 [Alnus glutinosa]|uniref:organelle RRM domain-containing protein 2, mitochondrial-like isoform X2 n=1 Tax=Alnus glutinosa TaxID=3517 RepID=UPI002D76D509|nr:organelle RRM domain-containing protein 2, mitochondrial-like isoform X2 [Alnus glutinosa]
MALRPGLVRRFLSTSVFSSQSSAFASASASDANANDKRAVTPSTTLFVHGLNKRTTSEKLQEAFSQFGDVVHARVARDPATGYSKGYGFVTYATLKDSEKGVKGIFLKGG